MEGITNKKISVFLVFYPQGFIKSYFISCEEDASASGCAQHKDKHKQG